MIKFDSMPNFRKLTVHKESIEKDDSASDYGNCLSDIKVYRSSKPDFLTEKEARKFCDLNFRTVIDFRSYDEYSKGGGNNYIDNVYSLYKAKLPKWRNYNEGEDLVLKRIKTPKNLTKPLYNKPKKESDVEDSDNNDEIKLINSNNPIIYNPRSNQDTSTSQTTTKHSDHTGKNSNAEKRHIMINFFTINLIWTIFNRVSIGNRIISLFILFYDFIMGNNKLHFVRFYVKHTINKGGVKGLYTDLINHSQPSICSALKLLSEPDNLPVMINCAHGKDRTGIISALVLSVLGYPKEYIVEDFAKSAKELEPIRDQVMEDIVGRLQVDESFAETQAESMYYVFDYIDQNYGGVTQYLEKIGFTLSDQSLLIKNLSCSTSR